MKKYSILFLATILCFTSGFGQTYKQLIAQADSLYNIQNYKRSAEIYLQAFKLEKKNKNDLYNAACSAALAGDVIQSFEFLEAAFYNGWIEIEHIKNDTDLEGLHKSEKWQALLTKMQGRIDSIESNYDKPLQKDLIQIFEDDQATRNQYTSAVKKFGYKNPVVDSLSSIILFKDSVNLIKVTKILDEKGWVGKNKVGEKANATLFLVIQHSDLKTQEKYLPMMREAVRNGNANSNALALLEDRVALRQGKKQIYGSQIYRIPETNEPYIAPLEDPDNVDRRRAEMGLGSINEYAVRMGVVWNVAEYKNRLPEFEELLKKEINKAK